MKPREIALGPSWDRLYADLRFEQLVQNAPICTCQPPNSGWVHVHAVGCQHAGQIPVPADPKPKIPKLILPPGAAVFRNTRYKRRQVDRVATSPYKLMLQFYFQRPVDIALWKRIRAPRGWRKCPTTEAKQYTFCSVRFQCRDMKHALTPDEVQELQARLYFCLKEVF